MSSKPSSKKSQKNNPNPKALLSKYIFMYLNHGKSISEYNSAMNIFLRNYCIKQIYNLSLTYPQIQNEVNNFVSTLVIKRKVKEIATNFDPDKYITFEEYIEFLESVFEKAESQYKENILTYDFTNYLEIICAYRLITDVCECASEWKGNDDKIKTLQDFCKWRIVQIWRAKENDKFRTKTPEELELMELSLALKKEQELEKLKQATIMEEELQQLEKEQALKKNKTEKNEVKEQNKDKDNKEKEKTKDKEKNKKKDKEQNKDKETKEKDKDKNKTKDKENKDEEKEKNKDKEKNKVNETKDKGKDLEKEKKIDKEKMKDKEMPIDPKKSNIYPNIQDNNNSKNYIDKMKQLSEMNEQKHNKKKEEQLKRIEDMKQEHEQKQKQQKILSQQKIENFQQQFQQLGKEKKPKRSLPNAPQEQKQIQPQLYYNPYESKIEKPKDNQPSPSQPQKQFFQIDPNIKVKNPYEDSTPPNQSYNPYEDNNPTNNNKDIPNQPKTSIYDDPDFPKENQQPQPAKKGKRSLPKNQDNKNIVIKTQKIVEDPLHSSQSDPLANIAFPIKNQSDDYHKVKIQLLNNLIPSLIKSVNEDKIKDAIKKGDIINKFISNIT